MATPDDLSVLRLKPYCEAVTKLEELMTQSGPAFLIGAGCSKCAGLPLMEELTDKALLSSSLGATTKKILEDLKALFVGATDANIEDYLSELVDLLAVTERRVSRGATKNQVDLNGQTYNANQLREAVEEIKRAIATIIDSDITIDTHLQFVRAIHQPTRPGKLNQNPPVDYLVLNYDTLLEDALAIEKITMADGLDGGVTGWWNPSTFHRKGLEARILKIHGSIDWCEFQDDPLPRRVANKLNVHPINERRILIWPASTKYRETQRVQNPEYTGHPFRFELDTDSGKGWTVIPVLSGH